MRITPLPPPLQPSLTPGHGKTNSSFKPVTPPIIVSRAFGLG